MYCSVDSCTTRSGNGLSFFRCPKDENRCKIWKDQLGITGKHLYAHLTPEKCYERIRICSLHFSDDSFISSEKQRLNYNAIPTLHLSRPKISSINNCSGNINASFSKEFKDAAIQMDTCVQVDAIVQTNGDIKTDQSCQTSQKLASTTPRKIALKRKITSLEKGAAQVKKKLELEITLEDVEKFLQENYAEGSYNFLKTQLSLLNKAPKGCRYTDDFSKFKGSILAF